MTGRPWSSRSRELATKSGNELTGRSVWLYKVSGGKLMSAEFFGDTAQVRDALS
jgi:ketosteroid isomerase-like protein